MHYEYSYPIISAVICFFKMGKGWLGNEAGVITDTGITVGVHIHR